MYALLISSFHIRSLIFDSVRVWYIDNISLSHGFWCGISGMVHFARAEGGGPGWWVL